MQINKEHIKAILRQATKIFGRYFTVFFIILLSLVTFGQYTEQGKINLLDSIAFSFPIACLGAAIAAVVITFFKRLEAAPPWVQPSDFLSTDAVVLKTKLTKIKKIRRLLFSMFILWLPYGMFIAATNLPIFFAFAYLAGIVIISFILYFSKCPRCDHYIFYRPLRSCQLGDTGSEKLNLLFGGGYRNVLSGKCVNCGLSLEK